MYNGIMDIRHLVVVLSILLLISACSVSTSPGVDILDDPQPPDVTAPFSCLEGEVNPLGIAIAEDYEFTSYDEVMDLFCNGAEFEDILVALETEALIGTPAEQTLQMLADDFTWEEI